MDIKDGINTNIVRTNYLTNPSVGPKSVKTGLWFDPVTKTVKISKNLDVENPVNVSQPIPALSTTISIPMKPLPIPDPIPNTTVVNSSIPNIIDVTLEPPSSELNSISNSTGHSAPIYPYVIPIDIHPQPANSKVSI